MFDNIRVAHVPYDCIDRHSYEEWKAMTYDEMWREADVTIYTLPDFQAAFNFDEISDLSYIFFYEIQ